MATPAAQPDKARNPGDEKQTTREIPVVVLEPRRD